MIQILHDHVPAREDGGEAPRARADPRPHRAGRGPGTAAGIRPRRVRRDPGPDRPRALRRRAGRAHTGPLPFRGPRDPAADPALQGRPGDRRGRPQSRSGRLGDQGPRQRLAAGSHRDRHAHPGRPLHLREPQELLPQGRHPRLLGRPPDLHGAPAVGAHRVDRGAARGGLEGGLLPLPDRAHRLEGAAPPHRARGLLGPQERLHGGGRLRGDGPQRPGSRSPPPQPSRPGDRRRLRPRLHRVAAGGQLHLPGHRAVPGRLGRPGPSGPGDGRRRLHRSRAAAGRVPGPHGGGRGPPAAEGRRPSHRRHRLLQQRLRHLPHRAHRRHRDPGVGSRREARRGDAARRPPGQGRLHPEGGRHPDPEGQAGVAPRAQRRHSQVIRVPGDPRALQPLPGPRALLRQRPGPEGDHRPHRLHVRRRRDRGPLPQGGRLRRAPDRLRALPLLLQGRRGPAHGPGRGVRPHLVQHLGRLRGGEPAPLLLRLLAAGAPGGGRPRQAAHRVAGDDLGGPGGQGHRGGLRRAGGPPALRALRADRDAQRPLS